MRLTRRNVLRAAALGALGSPSCSSRKLGELPGDSPFKHGVASGDPTPDRVILWTRLSVEDDGSTVEGDWQIFEDPETTRLVVSGTFETDASRDFTVHVDAEGLDAGTTYYYRFTYDGWRSVLGRTKTAPKGEVSRLRFAVASCASFGHGYFHAYRAIAERLDLDGVVHLGDYIYEYGPGYGEVREYEPPKELIKLEDYRRRYAQHRADPDLRELHRQHPMMAVWDDHEVANNAWFGGAENHNAGEGDYFERKRAAQQAYHEWMPIRSDDPARVHRRLTFGDLVDLLLLDTRHWGRSQQIDDANDPEFEAEERTMLGEDQELWLKEEFEASHATWKLLAQQVMVSDLPLDVVNTDSWSGYPAARRRLFELADGGEPLVVLSGDIHMSWALDLINGDDDTPLGAEFVTTSITSPSLERELAESARELALESGYVEFADLWRRGYMLIDVDRERVQAEWYLFNRVDERSAEERFRGAAALFAGERSLTLVDAASEPFDDPPPAAPDAGEG